MKKLTYISLILFLLFLCLFTNDKMLYAQDRKTDLRKDSLDKTLPDSLKVQKRIKKPFKFTIDGVRIGFDILYPVYDNFIVPPNPFNPDEPLREAYGFKRRYEGSIDVSFAQNRFFAVFDYGFSAIERIRKGLFYTGFAYKNTGSYFRIGADYNFMHRTFKDEVMFVGFRYAQANFKHDFQFLGANAAWDYPVPRVVTTADTSLIIDDRYVGNINESGLSASWMELVLGLKVNVWKQLFMGYTTRIMIRSGIKGENALLANELPGFGSTNRTARVSFNYYIAYRLAFKTKPRKIIEKVIEKTN
jgi:hypothetical protein